MSPTHGKIVIPIVDIPSFAERRDEFEGGSFSATISGEEVSGEILEIEIEEDLLVIDLVKICARSRKKLPSKQLRCPMDTPLRYLRNGTVLIEQGPDRYRLARHPEAKW